MAKLKGTLEITISSFGESFLKEEIARDEWKYMRALQGIWQFHKYDKDFWPSKPHGHNKESPETLDVYTGTIYDPRSRKPVGTLRRKYLKQIQAELKTKGFFTESQLKNLI